MKIDGIRKGSRGGILKRKRYKELETNVPTKIGRWGKRLEGGNGEDFCNKKWRASYKKKMEVCLELQRGQEI